MPGLEKSGFIDVFHSMYSPLKNFVYYKTGDIELAEDIAQDAFVKLWEKKEEIHTNSIKSLLYTIAANLCKNRFEHQRVVFEFTRNYTLGNNSASPEFEMEMKEFSLKLERAIGELGEKERIVFLMNRIDGLTYYEIASNLGLSVKAIEKRMKKALHDLKRTVEFKL